MQLGIGAIPDAVLKYLFEKRDLGIHTELFSDGVIDLVEAGVLTNARKSLHPGKIIAGFVLGTERLYRWVDGVGGQLDFIYGASRSKGGVPIIALPSTAKDISRIVAMLKPGAGVVTSRNHVRYIITEYGIADLYGKTIRQRASALINIAHPDFRDELTCQARELHYI
jgi:acetyl-CoA hydrolase